MKTIRGTHGLTLIEVVAALGIIAIGIVGILTLFPLAIEAADRAGNRTSAAILGEYVIEQVRLRAGQVERTDTTADMLEALNWNDYTYKSRDFTFDATVDPTDGNGYGSGEQIMWQRDNPNNSYDPDDPANPNSGLSDQELYSRYEVTLRLDDVEDDPFPKDELKQVIVTVRWPRAFSDAGRRKQDTMRFVTFIRPAE